MNDSYVTRKNVMEWFRARNIPVVATGLEKLDTRELTILRDAMCRSEQIECAKAFNAAMGR